MKLPPTAEIDLSKLAVDPRDRSSHMGTQLASTISNFGSAIDSYLISNSSIVNAMIDNSAAIDLSKLATDPLDRSNHTGSQTAGTISDFTTQVNTDIAAYRSSNPIVNADIATTAAIDLSKLASDPLDRSNHTGTQLASTVSDFSTAVSAALSDGNGISIDGSTINTIGTAGTIDVSNGTIDIDATYAGQTSITTLGTVSEGTWNGDAVSILYGGTGAQTKGEAANKLTAVRTITASDTLDVDDRCIIADATASVITIGLPSADDVYEFTIKKMDNSNNVIINADVGDLIDGLASHTLTTQYDYIILISDGNTNWSIISHS